MEDLKESLLTLQGLDDEIKAARERLVEFEPQLKQVDEPVARLEAEIEVTTKRLADFRAEIKRLEAAASQKRERLSMYEERLTRVRTTREEGAARAEMDLVRRAADADDSEALQLMDQATRTDLKLDDMIKQLDKLRTETAPQREGIVAAQKEATDRLAVLQQSRENHAIRLDPPLLRLYEQVRRGRATMAVAPLTEEGACGHCFNTLPLQEQSEIRRGENLRRCEAFGVILYAS